MARPEDGPAVAAIYDPLVEFSIATFETEPPGGREMSRRIAATLPRHPWLVAEKGSLIGYAYATPHRTRPAYRWAVDVSVYVDPTHRGTGMGRGLYESLIEILVLQGFRTAHAGISLPNPASVALHEAMGFIPVGVYPRVGWKLGEWRDVGWWRRDLADTSDPLPDPRHLTAIDIDRMLAHRGVE